MTLKHNPINAIPMLKAVNYNRLIYRIKCCRYVQKDQSDSSSLVAMSVFTLSNALSVESKALYADLIMSDMPPE